ncbi:MAG: bifunctional MaoC family dehydratase N-terminal/OB-fold nucleic acid binding domain-containing protein [Micromonosporaceae bacterium]
MTGSPRTAAATSAPAPSAAGKSAEILEVVEKLKARGESAPRLAPDPVNRPMIRHWTEALGDENPRWSEVAPPAMLQVWTMHGLRGERAPDDPLGAMMAVLDEAGFTAVVATNCEQTYHRYLRVGERLSVTSRLEEVTGPKRTALGEGWFVTTRSTWYAGDEPVGEMLFRVLRYRPAPRPAGAPMRPPVSPDTAFFWEGTAAGELRIQRCNGCGLLRHPPGPMCPRCGGVDVGYAVAAGTGEVFSYVVHHHPPLPGRGTPFVVALVELPEGVRVLAELLDVDPTQVRIGMPVDVGFQRIDNELTLPVWRPA